jgi:hypothetical protein
VQTQVSDRLDDAEENLAELSTEVRLQARRSSVATQLQLPLAGSNAGSAAASPRGEDNTHNVLFGFERSFSFSAGVNYLQNLSCTHSTAAAEVVR